MPTGLIQLQRGAEKGLPDATVGYSIGPETKERRPA